MQCSVVAVTMIKIIYFSLVFYSAVFAYEESFHMEFGNVLGQKMLTTDLSDSYMNAIMKYIHMFCKKRFPWHQERHQPEVHVLRKMRLVYTYDGKSPLYLESEIPDRNGYYHGVTRFFPLGMIYTLKLSWKHHALIYIHNFTVSIYPKTIININAHAFFILNLNSSTSTLAEVNNQILHHHTSYFKHFTYFDKEELYSSTTDKAGFYVQSQHKSDGNEYSRYSLDLHRYIVGTSQHWGDERSPHTHKNVPASFTVMTYNVWNMNAVSDTWGSYTSRMEKLKEMLLKFRPDILALQEVRYEESKGETLGSSQIRTLSEWLPEYQFVYQPAQMQPNTFTDGNTEEGVAIMSKYPIVSHDYMMLYINHSNSADLHQRILLHAEIHIPVIGKVNVFTTHLSLSHEAREQSVVQIWERIQHIHGPVIVLGDFNAEPQEHALQYLFGNLIFPGKEKPELFDVWTICNPQDIGYTFSALEANLTKRIDYIFFKPDKRCCDIDWTKVIDNGLRGENAASDHVPVMSSFTMRS